MTHLSFFVMLNGAEDLFAVFEVLRNHRKSAFSLDKRAAAL